MDNLQEQDKELQERFEREQSYLDKNGKEIKECAVLKIFHFKGVNDRGNGRKNYYMYKWVQLKEHKGKLYWVALHLTNNSGDYFHLRSIAKDGVINDAEIVQQY